MSEVERGADKFEPDYPECEKLSTLLEKRDVVLEFLEWLGDKNCDGLLSHFSHEQISHRFLDIDDDKLEAERKDMFMGLQSN